MNKKIDYGFTLVELLVVISIIAVLLGVLMPVLSKARAGGQTTICLANVRRLAIAGAMYVQDYKEFPPFRMTNDGSPNGSKFVNKYGREMPRWQWFFDQGIGPVITPSKYLTDTKKTFGDKDSLIMTNQYFFCPSFKFMDYNANDIRNGSYGYNYQYLGNSNVADGKYVNYPVPLSRIIRPSETVIIADGRGAGIPHGVHSYTLDPPKIARSTGFQTFAFYKSGAAIQQSPADPRHSNRANASFVDGHAKSMSLTSLGYVLDDNKQILPDDPRGSNCLWSGTGKDE
ncbi:MAG: hypothetical protein A2Y10_00890 [Planctomycetes bacterium GWF2_41_51]|nr:MAG: hypothetical protein A2Y10_00890 [Planctomycetes bacterium GWF2_41_51]HBG28110.1 hypothetical protein [Phycisphaerales bacterium]